MIVEVYVEKGIEPRNVTTRLYKVCSDFECMYVLQIKCCPLTEMTNLGVIDVED